MKKEKINVEVGVSNPHQASEFIRLSNIGVEDIFLYAAELQERSDFDWAVNNHFNDDENPTVFTVIIL